MPAQNVGDRDRDIPAAKKYLGRFSYGRGLGDTDEYTIEFGVALRQWQTNIHYQVAFKGRPGPDVNQLGILNWACKKQMGLLEPPPAEQLPWIITVSGHLGTWDTGPAYWCALPLQQQGKAVVQGVGYDAASIPFNNRSGLDELNRIVHHVKPPGVPWCIASHSQGAIITSDYLQHNVIDHQGVPAYANFRGGVHFGSPRRPRGIVASWITDPPDADSEGLDPDCLPAALPGVAEASRRKDLYADKKRDNAGEMKQAVYLAVARGRLTGKDSLAEQMGELVTNFGPEVWAIFRAIVDGIGFAIDMDAHNIFSLAPATRHLESVLTADRLAA
ncbi:MAG: hypothetical protein ACPGVG_10040 [Mycobacterium sp.]